MPGFELRPLSLGELLDRTFSLYRRHFLLFAGITAIPYLGAILLVMVTVVTLGIASPFALSRVGRPIHTAAEIGAMAGGIAVALAFIYCAFALSAGATCYAVAELYQGRKPTSGESLRASLGRMLSLLGLMIVCGIIIVGGMLFLIFPGVYLACRLSAAVPPVVVEKAGAFDAISRSFRLTKSFAGRAFLVYVLNLALVYAGMFLIQMPFLVLMQATLHQPAMSMVFAGLSQLGSFLSSILVTPIMSIAFVVYYFDLRVRKEGFDLQMMMQSIGTEAPSPAPLGGGPGAIGSDAL